MTLRSISLNIIQTWWNTFTIPKRQINIYRNYPTFKGIKFEYMNIWILVPLGIPIIQLESTLTI